MQPELTTERLLLRRARLEDRDAFLRLHDDPRVVEFLGGAPGTEQATATLRRWIDSYAVHDLGPLMIELPGQAGILGVVGLSRPRFEAPFLPAVEVLWRLGADHWGKGYATEGARAVLADGFGRLALDEIVSFTTVANHRSRAVMERLGFSRDPDGDFAHPGLPEGHPLRSHVLYRLPRSVREDLD